MTVDTLAYVKHLESRGIDRRQAEAHAEAMVNHIFPQLSTKTDIVELKHDLTLRLIAIIGAFDALLFAALHFAK
jgi:hypothetical protein